MDAAYPILTRDDSAIPSRPRSPTPNSSPTHSRSRRTCVALDDVKIQQRQNAHTTNRLIIAVQRRFT